MTDTALTRILDALAKTTGTTASGSGRQFMARCPVHNDSTASLSVTDGTDRVLLKCHAGCDNADVLTAVDLTFADLFNERRQHANGHTTVVAEYRYVDEAGHLLYVVERHQPKTFRQKRPEGTGWIYKMGDVQRVLYRLPEVLAAAHAGHVVYIVEGEKDADRLTALGHTATCNVGGAGKWRDTYSPTLRGARVIVITDMDDPGRAHAATVIASLRAAGVDVQLAEPAVGKDISDHLDAGGAMDDVVIPESTPDEPSTSPQGDPVDDDDEEAGRLHQAQILARATDEALLRLRARFAAEDLYRAERVADQTLPEVIGLDKLLTEDDEPVRYRIDRLWPVHGRVMLAAQFKAGKTTLIANLMRSLVDGQAFLGTYDVEPVVDGTVVLLDTELSRSTLRRWLRDQSYLNPARIVVVPMRGRSATFDLLDDRQRALWARIIADQGARVLTLDCLGPVLAGQGLDENKPSEVGRFLAGFEALLDEAKVDEAVVVHHMGHVGERSRGASRLRDWPDAEWKLVREADEDTGEPAPDARRYFSALGRDVSEAEALLTYDTVTRRLGLVGGNRRETKATKWVPAVLAYIAANPDQSLRAIERGLVEAVGRNDVRAAVRLSISDGTVCIHDGPRNGNLHRIKLQCAECAAVRRAQSSECASAPIGGALHSLTQSQDQEKQNGALTQDDQERALISCRICYGPLDDVDGTGTHPTCQTDDEPAERERYP